MASQSLLPAPRCDAPKNEGRCPDPATWLLRVEKPNGTEAVQFLCTAHILSEIAAAIAWKLGLHATPVRP